MVSKVGPEDLDLRIKFGGGLHTRASEDEIDPREAADGENFTLDLQNRDLRKRMPFDLVGTVPNAAEIRGGGSWLAADGSVSTLFQAGDTVYEWDGIDTFTSRGTVSASARLRGHWRTHNWTLDDKLLLTDLALEEVVQEWNGTTLSPVSFVNEDDSGFGDFYAKYLIVSNERAVFGHVRDSSTTTRHMLVGSLRGDYEQITVSNRPSSALSEADPFFLLTPDLRPINGLVEAFGTTALSTQHGQIFNLSGSSAQSFVFEDFYAGSGASGEESLAYVGNDVIYGRPGRIESVKDTDRFGESEANDLTVGIADQVAGYTGWRIVYNSRIDRTYLFPSGQSEVWVYENPMRGDQVSPWMRWRTTHAIGFRPTFVMSMLDPDDGLEYVFMGDDNGNIYRLEGSGSQGDAGVNEISLDWLSKLFSAPLDSQVYLVEGWVKYRKSVPATVEIVFEYAGEAIFDETITIDLPRVEEASYYGGDAYYGGDFHYGSVAGRLSRQTIMPAGQGNEFQVRVRVVGNTAVELNEIGLRFRAASS